MKKPDINDFLQQNPKANRHGESIREALDALRQLRESGVSGGGSPSLTSPYVGGASVKNVPRPAHRRVIGTYSKVTFSA